MGDAKPCSIVRHMGLTHREFLRSLAAAVLGMDLHVEDSHIVVRDSARRIEIRLGPERERLLGSLALPQTEVSLVFEGFSREGREEFLRRFDLAFRRGGG